MRGIYFCIRYFEYDFFVHLTETQHQDNAVGRLNFNSIAVSKGDERWGGVGGTVPLRQTIMDGWKKY